VEPGSRLRTPPAVIEAVLRVLLPPGAREHVLGDLAEGFTSTRQYLLTAGGAVLAVVFSQIRRTSYFPLWPPIGLVLFVAFCRGEERWNPGALVAALVVLLTFMVRDAYRRPDPAHPWRQGLVDVAIVYCAIRVCAGGLALLRPDWAIGAAGLRGGAAVVAVLYLLRVHNPTGRVPRSA
jgi:hypothetical protein